jgi:hypothetical protein
MDADQWDYFLAVLMREPVYRMINGVVTCVIWMPRKCVYCRVNLATGIDCWCVMMRVRVHVFVCIYTSACV